MSSSRVIHANPTSFPLLMGLPGQQEAVTSITGPEEAFDKLVRYPGDKTQTRGWRVLWENWFKACPARGLMGQGDLGGSGPNCVLLSTVVTDVGESKEELTSLSMTKMT